MLKSFVMARRYGIDGVIEYISWSGGDFLMYPQYGIQCTDPTIGLDDDSELIFEEDVEDRLGHSAFLDQALDENGIIITEIRRTYSIIQVIHTLNLN